MISDASSIASLAVRTDEMMDAVIARVLSMSAAGRRWPAWELR